MLALTFHKVRLRCRVVAMVVGPVGNNQHSAWPTGTQGKNRSCRPGLKWPIVLKTAVKYHYYHIRLKKKILCLKAAARICFSVRIWFCRIRTFIFFFLKLFFFFYFYYEKRRKFAVLEEFKHVGAQKTCKIPFDFWKYGSWNFSVILVSDVLGGKGQLK